MIDITYKEIPPQDEAQVRNLISKVLGELERPEFFIPYAEWELNSLFDKSYALLDGAYVGDKLVGMAQLYLQQEMLNEFKDVLGLREYKVCELGGNLVLKEYRGHGIMYHMIRKQLEDARRLQFDYVISMAHPDNAASLKSLKKLGLEFMKNATVSNGHEREIVGMKL